MTNRPNTPGFNIHLDITFKVAKNGQRRATYWSRASMRKLPVPAADADLWIAQGLASEYKPQAAA